MMRNLAHLFGFSILVWLMALVPNVSVQGQDDERLLILYDSDESSLLYTANLDGSDIIPFPDMELLKEFDLRWLAASPDGTKIAFKNSVYYSANEYTREIFMFDSKDNFVQQITFQSSSAEPVWSPDGTKIAYLTNGAIGMYGEIRVYDLINNTDISVLELGSGEPDITMTDIEWSPDGSSIAIQAMETTYPNDDVIRINVIAVINVDGANFRFVSDRSTDAVLGGWSKDSQFLYGNCPTEIASTICLFDLGSLEIITLFTSSDIAELQPDNPYSKKPFIQELYLSEGGNYFFRLVSEYQDYLYCYDPITDTYAQIPNVFPNQDGVSAWLVGIIPASP